MPIRLSTSFIGQGLRQYKNYDLLPDNSADADITAVDVFIAGSGPIAAGYARTILEGNSNKKLKVLMVDIGAQDGPGIGVHQKNAIKYQKDIDAFVSVIKGALQKVSVPPSDTHIAMLGGDGWTPGFKETLICQGNNPKQDPRLNLKDFAVTRTVGGMATHWTCACPFPDEEEIANNPIDKSELKTLLTRASKLLNVHDDQYDSSIRHTVVKKWLTDKLPRKRGVVRSLPLGVERRQDNPHYVTWTGTDTVLGDTLKDTRFELWQETRVTSLHKTDDAKIGGALVRRLSTNNDVLVTAKVFIIACGAIGTPQILVNSNISVPKALGRYLCEQSIAFCQIVLKREIIDYINTAPDFAKKVKAHRNSHLEDPLPIPFNDPEPQVSIPYTRDFPWHTQIHRDAFNYGEVGPRADPRVVVDLRFFGKQDINPNNMVYFGQRPHGGTTWRAGATDIYGMPQATFEVQRSQADHTRDHRMMEDMTQVASILGTYLPGSEPHFMNPGLALHVTGTTRIGTDLDTSVADPSSKVHGWENLWVGGNGCIPDSTSCNPTLTSLAIALKGADSVIQYLKSLERA
ncbi:GMC oxidoreductase [Sphaerobolus stellatus SS14]|nr:GMC oxidoreductase [Sphaerobolus stellatus SS14]